METASGLFMAFEGLAQLSLCNLKPPVKAHIDCNGTTWLGETDQRSPFQAVNLTQQVTQKRLNKK